MSLVPVTDQPCMLCYLRRCGVHHARLAVGDGVGRPAPIPVSTGFFVVPERVFENGVLVAGAGDVIPIGRARELGLLADSAPAPKPDPEQVVEPKQRRRRARSDTRAKRLSEDRMAGRGEEDR